MRTWEYNSFLIQTQVKIYENSKSIVHTRIIYHVGRLMSFSLSLYLSPVYVLDNQKKDKCKCKRKMSFIILFDEQKQISCFHFTYFIWYIWWRFITKKKLRNFVSHFLLLCSTFSFSFFFFLIQFVSSYLGKQQQQVTWPIPSIIESFDLFFALRPSQMVRHIQTQLSSLIMIGFYFVLFPNESNWNNKIKEITIY